MPWFLRKAKHNGCFLADFDMVVAALYRGRWPTHTVDGDVIGDERAGSCLASGYVATLWLPTGDLDYVKKTLGLEHSGSLTPCAKCRAKE